MSEGGIYPIVLFDGVCNFCNGTVNFLLKQDRKQKLRFAALQSTAGQQLLQRYKLPQENFGSFVFIENGTAYTQSTAGLRLYKHLPWYWQWTRIFWLVPKFLRDGVYNFIARNRYKWFGKREACRIPTAEERKRFLSSEF